MVSRHSGFVFVILPTALGAAFAFLVSTAWAGDIVLSLEEPVADSTYSGVANIRGWVVGSAGINRVELYVDGELKTNIPVGGRRADVGDAYPDYPNSANSGFSMAFNYSGLSAGPHTISVRAIDQEQTVKDSSAAFSVTRFDNSYISDASRISLNGATVSHDSGRTIFINNMTADGKTYDIRLDWRTAIQGYAISQIIPTGEDGQNPDFSGTYQFTTDLVNEPPCFTESLPNSNGTLTLNQSGAQLSGNIGGLSVSGAVDEQGNFSLISPVAEQVFDDNCKLQGYVAQQGNFINNNITLSYSYQLIGSAESCSGQCVDQYQGVIQKTSTVSIKTSNHSARPTTSGNIPESGLEGLLKGLKRPMNTSNAVQR
jgi:hypothetical protein